MHYFCIRISFGKLHEEHGRYDDARKEYLLAYGLIDKTEEKWQNIGSLLSLASVDISTKRYADAEKRLLEAEKIVEKIGVGKHKVQLLLRLLTLRTCLQEYHWRNTFEVQESNTPAMT